MASTIDYNSTWGQMRLRSHSVWPVWPLLMPYTVNARRRLEIGAGALPKFPVPDTYFLDTSKNAIAQLQKHGGNGVVLNAERPFPFQAGFFDLVGAFEVLEHLERPEKALGEVAKVLTKSGFFLFSVPVHQHYWSPWDVLAGHVQRFEPEQLQKILSEQALEVECCYVLKRGNKYKFPLVHYFHELACAIISKFPVLYYCWDLCFYPYTWILRQLTDPEYHKHLSEVPSDSMSLLVVCKKMQ